MTDEEDLPIEVKMKEYVTTHITLILVLYEMQSSSPAISTHANQYP